MLVNGDQGESALGHANSRTYEVGSVPCSKGSIVRPGEGCTLQVSPGRWSTAHVPTTLRAGGMKEAGASLTAGQGGCVEQGGCRVNGSPVARRAGGDRGDRPVAPRGAPPIFMHVQAPIFAGFSAVMTGALALWVWLDLLPTTRGTSEPSGCTPCGCWSKSAGHPMSFVPGGFPSWLKGRWSRFRTGLPLPRPVATLGTPDRYHRTARRVLHLLTAA
jgi:hypothetical protein